MTSEDFQKGITALKSGKVPDCFSDMIAYFKWVLPEWMAFTDAAIECIQRLNNDNAILRDILAKADVRYENGPNGPRKIIGGQE